MVDDQTVMDFSNAGKVLLLVGGLIALAGLVLLLAGKVPSLGRLPGDITFRRGNVSCYVPIVTSILPSLLLTLVLNLIARLLSR
jgi:hypothetical protein